MKGIEAIVAHIEADSRQECGALLQAAQRQAEELREHGRQKQARFADREHERMEEHLAQIEQSRRQLLIMERRSALLQARQAVVEEAFAAARASLEGLDTARREKLYLKLAEAAVEPEKEGEALVCREDRASFGAALQRTYPKAAPERRTLHRGGISPALRRCGSRLHTADASGSGAPSEERSGGGTAVWYGGRR